MKKRTSYFVILAIIIVAIAIDLITKGVFQRFFDGGQPHISLIGDFLKLTYLENTGAAFGMFSGNVVALTVVSSLFIVAFVVFDWFNHSNNIWYVLALGFIVGGAVGNIIDRIFLGYVRDFVSMSIFPFVFNLADMFISIGVVCFAIYLIISMVKESKEKGSKHGMDNK